MDFPFCEAATPLFVSSFSRYGIGIEARNGGAGTFAAFTWTANQAVYIPIAIPWPYQVRRLFWVNGSTITTSNADIGIYTEGGGRIFSQGSTAMSGASAVQYVTPATPFWLTPGRYYLAWNCSSTTSRAFGFGTSTANMKYFGALNQAVGAVALPSPATFATATGPGIPICGITRTASGF